MAAPLCRAQAGSSIARARSVLSTRASVPCAGRRALPRRQLTASVRATAEPEQQEPTKATPTPVLANLRTGGERFMQRYEGSLLSSGVGALAVTTYCVLRGQDVATAASITVVATISALVLNELLFSDSD